MFKCATLSEKNLKKFKSKCLHFNGLKTKYVICLGIYHFFMFLKFLNANKSFDIKIFPGNLGFCRADLYNITIQMIFLF